MFNLTPAIYTITINNIDVSANLISANCSYSSVGTEGFVVKTGNIVLALGNYNRFTFKAGHEITILRNALPAPICGCMTIESVEIDANADTLQISTTCKIGLLNKLSINELGVCIDVVAGSGNADAAKFLLQSVGIAANKINLAGFNNSTTIFVPIILGDGDSAIRLAGEIAFAAQKILYEDASGIIRAAEYNPSNNILLHAQPQDVLQIETQPFEYAAKQVQIASSAVSYLRQPSQNTSETIIELDANTLATTTTTASRNLDRAARKIVESTKVVSSNANVVIPTDVTDLNSSVISPGSLQISLHENEDQYELKVAGAFNPAATQLFTCIPRDEGRIRTSVEKITRPAGAALADFIRARLQFEQNYGGSTTVYNLLAQVSERRITKTWSYNIPRSGLPIYIDASGGASSAPLLSAAAISTGVSITCTTETQQAIGAAFPVFGQPTFGRINSQTGLPVNERVNVVPESLITTQILKQTWTRSTNGQSWSLQEVVQEALPSEGVYNLIQNLNMPLIYVVDAVTKLYTRTSTTKINEEPAEPQRFPTLLNIFEQPIVVYKNVANSASIPNGNGIIKYSVNGQYTTVDALRELADTLAYLVRARIYTDLITLPVEIVAANSAPFARIKVNSIVGAAQVNEYAMDAASIAITQTEEIFTFNALTLAYYTINGSTLLPNSQLPIDADFAVLGGQLQLFAQNFDFDTILSDLTLDNGDILQLL